VLAVRIARNHPLPDGNKRLAWQSLTIFLALNDVSLTTTVDDAVALMLGIAAGEIDEESAEGGSGSGSSREAEQHFYANSMRVCKGVVAPPAR